MIPISTTTISVLEQTAADEYAEPYEGQTEAQRVASAVGVRAVIGAPSGSEIVRGGEQMVAQYSLQCDPTPMTHRSWVKDEMTGRVYTVVWCKDRIGLGLDHVQAQLRVVEGGV